MIRKQKSQKPGIENLEALEQETENEVKHINAIRKAEFAQELNTGFYFSVVFLNKQDRDLWLKNHNINLIEDLFVKASDFLI